MKFCKQCGKHIQDHFETCSDCKAKPPLAAASGSETQAITAMVGPAGQVMMVQAQGKVLLLEREEAMELYEAIKTNLGKMSVQI